MKKIISIILTMVLILSLSVTAFAVDSDVSVNGAIGVQDNPRIDPVGDPTSPDGTYDLTFATAAYWYVTQNTYPNVVNGTSAGPDDLHDNLIINNSAADITVGFNSFTPDSVGLTIESDLVLNLTGDLDADDIMGENISAGWTTPFTYTNKLEAKDTWEYGFTGQYTLPSGTTSLNGISYNPVYTMNLEFSFQ